MGVSILKERIKEEILIYDLLQLSSLIYHAVPVHSSITPWKGAFSLLLSACAAGHSSSCLGNKLCALLGHSTAPFVSALLSQPQHQTPRMNGIRHYR